MKAINTKTANFSKITIEEYGSFNEFSSILKSRPNTLGHSSSEGNGDYNEELTKLLKGWSEKSKEINDRVRRSTNSLSTQDKLGVKTKYDIQGFMPIIPKVLIGDPKCMMTYSRVKPKKSKIVDIVVDGTCSWSTSAETILEYGANVLAKLIAIEKQGYRVRLSMLWSFCRAEGKDDRETRQHILMIPIKNEYEHLDITRFAYPLLNEDMLRVLAFRWYEHLPKAEYYSGYGRAFANWSSSSYKDELLKEVLKNKKQAYYININDRDRLDTVLNIK